jgi:hypothetical protein
MYFYQIINLLVQQIHYSISLNKFMLWFTIIISCSEFILCPNRAHLHTLFPGRSVAYAASICRALYTQCTLQSKRFNQDCSEVCWPPPPAQPPPPLRMLPLLRLWLLRNQLLRPLRPLVRRNHKLGRTCQPALKSTSGRMLRLARAVMKCASAIAAIRVSEGFQ